MTLQRGFYSVGSVANVCTERPGRAREPRDGCPCKRGSARALDLAGPCRARGALTQAWVQDPAGARRTV
eukprot:6083664-Pyramimonas_sp.AAC.1